MDETLIFLHLYIYTWLDIVHNLIVSTHYKLTIIMALDNIELVDNR